MLMQYSVVRIAIVALAAIVGSPCAARPIRALHHIKVVDGSQTLEIGVALDGTLVNLADEHRVAILGSRGHYVLIVDSYASKPEGLARCQSGNERYVRAIDLRSRRELFSKLAESCRKDLVPGDPIASWNGASTDFTVNMVSEPSITVRLDDGGRAVARPVAH